MVSVPPLPPPIVITEQCHTKPARLIKRYQDEYMCPASPCITVEQLVQISAYIALLEGKITVNAAVTPGRLYKRYIATVFQEQLFSFSSALLSGTEASSRTEM